MSENEVVENVDEITLVEDTTDVSKEQEITIREDLNKIVLTAKFEEVKSKFGTRHPFYVTFFNKEKVEFADPEGLYDLLMSYVKCGIKDYVKFKGLVEEPKLDDAGNTVGTYICMKYELEDGSIYRLFTRQYSANKIINNYYNLFNKLNNK